MYMVVFILHTNTPTAGVTQMGIVWYRTPEQVTVGKGRRKDGRHGWAEWDQGVRGPEG